MYRVSFLIPSRIEEEIREILGVHPAYAEIQIAAGVLFERGLNQEEAVNVIVSLTNEKN